MKSCENEERWWNMEKQRVQTIYKRNQGSTMYVDHPAIVTSHHMKAFTSYKVWEKQREATGIKPHEKSH